MRPTAPLPRYKKATTTKARVKRARTMVQRAAPLGLIDDDPFSFARVRRPLESNYVDLASASYACDTTGSLTLMATIPQGASVNQRIGKQANYKSALIRGSLTAGTTGTTADTTWMVVYDKRPTGALPLITAILTSISPRAFMNDDNTGRFEVVRRSDQVIIGNSTTPTTGGEQINIDVYIPLKGRPVTFESAGTGAIGDIDMGALYFVTFGDRAAGTAAPSLNAAFRVRYSD